jgi:hypothetical protein
MNKLLPLLFTILVVISQSCSKISGLSPYKDNNLSFKVGDKTYNAKVISITVNNQFIVINATADNDVFLAINLSGSPRVGAYNFAKGKDAKATISINQGAQTNLFGTDINDDAIGGFYLSSLDCEKKLISGSFYFTGFYKKFPEETFIPINVEEGYFQNVKYVGNFTCPVPEEDPIEEELVEEEKSEEIDL